MTHVLHLYRYTYKDSVLALKWSRKSKKTLDVQFVNYSSYGFFEELAVIRCGLIDKKRRNNAITFAVI